MSRAAVAGLLLAAGSGSRLGAPKALLTDETGRLFVVRALLALVDGGCTPVHVVAGASADVVSAQLGADVPVTIPDGWEEGMGVSLRAGLAALAGTTAGAALVMLVDTPDVTADVVRRLITRATGGASVPLAAALSRAAYDGAPGHPVLIGRDHWSGVRASAGGDRGARDYLLSHEVDVVECADIGAGDDIDTGAALTRWREHTGKRPAS